MLFRKRSTRRNRRGGAVSRKNQNRRNQDRKDEQRRKYRSRTYRRGKPMMGMW